MQPAEPAEAARRFLFKCRLANPAPFQFSFHLIKSRRKPVTRFPRVLASRKPLQVPAPLREAFVRRNDGDEAERTQLP